MYLRISKGRQKSYLVLVEGYRKDGKVKQRTICNLGPVDEKTAKKSLDLGRQLLNKFGGSALIDGSEITEESRKNWGAYEVLKKLWQRYGLDDFFEKKLSTRKLQYDLQDVLKLMVAGRLCKPTSKLALYEDQDFYDGFNKTDLQDFYKALDELHGYRDELKKYLFKNQQMINGKTQITFFDVTTMYFESKKFDDLRDFGFSKDCKFNEVQIVLSLLTDKNGRPLSYEIFKGNMYEGHTFIDCLKTLCEKYNVKKAVIVADRGMYSAENLEAIEKMGFEYIVGTRLKTSTSEIKKAVFNLKGYKNTNQFKYKTLNNNNGKTVIAWSKKRAVKDAQDRERLINKAKKLAESNNVFDKKGGRKYLKMTKTKAELDLQKIAQDREWDGYYGISTNSGLKARAVIDAYHNLWKIEKSFRLMKNYFATRPIFHWTAKRIDGHIMLNFISMIFECYIEDIVNEKTKSTRISARDIRKSIVSMQKSVLTIDGQCFHSYAKLGKNSQIILKKLSVSIPKNKLIN